MTLNVSSNLRFVLTHKNIFDNLIIDLVPDKVNVIQGKNGSGKSTALRLTYLSLLKDYEHMRAEFGVYGRKTIGGLTVKSFFSANGIEKIDDVISENLELPRALFEKKIKHLSTGECKKVFLSISVQRCLSTSRFLILDEPFESLDHECGKGLESLLSSLIAKDVVVFISNHNWVFSLPLNVIQL